MMNVYLQEVMLRERMKEAEARSNRHHLLHPCPTQSPKGRRSLVQSIIEVLDLGSRRWTDRMASR